MTQNISFFGASVTQQKFGYTYYLDQLLNVSTSTFGFGSCHLNDAGICKIDVVLGSKPTYCFIDWFSTAYNSIDDNTLEYIDTIIYKFSSANCKLIFLFLPRVDHNERIDFYNLCKKHLTFNNIFYIDLNERITHSPYINIDMVHTNSNGSVLYARTIYDIFIREKDNIIFPSNLIKTKYCDIKALAVNKTFKSNMVLEGDCTIVTCSLIIGPKSGLIEINNIKYNLWDEWCHYERSNCKLNNIFIKGNVSFNVLQDKIDTSTCRRIETNEDLNKELNIVEIYYIGDENCYLKFIEGK